MKDYNKNKPTFAFVNVDLTKRKKTKKKKKTSINKINMYTDSFLEIITFRE